MTAVRAKPDSFGEPPALAIESHSGRVVADAVFAALADAGVTLVAGFPGESSLPLYLAAQRQSRIRHVLARCPRCAGYLAEAYARVTGKVGVCDAPGGVGSPFITPALLEAYNSSTPLLFLASGVARHRRGRWTTGECEQQSLFRPVTKATSRLEIAHEVESRISEALDSAAAPRPGPVFLELPADILTEPYPVATVGAGTVQMFPPAPSQDAISAAAHLVRTARQVVVVAGGGVHQAGACEQLRLLASRTGLPIATTLNGKGAIDERLPNAVGVAGAKGSQTANAYIRDADCVIAIATKLGDKSTNQYRWPHDGQRLIHVDTSGTELTRFGHTSVPVLADAAEFIRALDTELAAFRYTGPGVRRGPRLWDDGIAANICAYLSDHLGDDDVVVADASVSSGWAGAVLQLRGGHQRLLTPRGSGSLSYALPAAMGAQLARPASRIYAIGGDGGFAMAMHEMETAVRNGLPVTYFLLNNQRLGLIDRHAVDLNGGDPVSDGFHSVAWQQVAAAFGWRSFLVRDNNDLAALWPELNRVRRPTLVECLVPVDENSPDFLQIRDEMNQP